MLGVKALFLPRFANTGYSQGVPPAMHRSHTAPPLHLLLDARQLVQLPTFGGGKP